MSKVRSKSVELNLKIAKKGNNLSFRRLRRKSSSVSRLRNKMVFIIFLFITSLATIPALSKGIEKEELGKIIQDYHLRPYFKKASAVFQPEFKLVKFKVQDKSYAAIAIKQGTKTKPGYVLIFDKDKNLIAKEEISDWVVGIKVRKIFKDRDCIAIITNRTLTFGMGIVDEHYHLFDFDGKNLNQIWDGQLTKGEIFYTSPESPYVIYYNNEFEDINKDGVKEIIQHPVKKRFSREDTDKVIRQKELPEKVFYWNGKEFVER